MDTEKFIVHNVQGRPVRRNPIGGTRTPLDAQWVSVTAVDVTCKQCGQDSALVENGVGLNMAVEYVLITCPKCKANEGVRTAKLLATIGREPE